MPKFVLPYEPEYTGHRETKGQQQKSARDSLRRREREVASPGIVPEPMREDEKVE